MNETGDHDQQISIVADNEKPNVTEIETETIKSGEVSQAQMVDEYDDGEDICDKLEVDTFQKRSCHDFGQFAWNYFKSVVEWDEQNCFGKFQILLESPLITVLRIISIPLVADDDSMYFRELLVLELICAPTLIMFTLLNRFCYPQLFWYIFRFI